MIKTNLFFNFAERNLIKWRVGMTVSPSVNGRLVINKLGLSSVNSRKSCHNRTPKNRAQRHCSRSDRILPTEPSLSKEAMANVSNVER